MSITLHGENGLAKRRVVFSDDILDKIPLWILDGWSHAQICKVVGCTENSLVVTCSKHRISLDRQAVLTRKLMPDRTHHKLPLSRVRLETLDALNKRADRIGIELSALITLMLERIVEDGLLDAVLDIDEDTGTRKRKKT